MKLKNIFKTLLLVFFSLFITACSVEQIAIGNFPVQEKVEKREPITPFLLNNINQILLTMKEEDIDSINNRFVHPIFGVYVVSKAEKENKIVFEHLNTLSEINSYIDSFEIKKEDANFNCSPETDEFYGWDKEGVFINDKVNFYLSSIMKEANILKEDSFLNDELKRVNLIEKTSYQVIIPFNVIFYITKIDGMWYITLIDEVKTDCTQY